jgi:6-phosphogluconolactonase
VTEHSRGRFTGGLLAGGGGRAYIGSFTSAGGRGITTADVDPETGALHPVHHTGQEAPDPSYLLSGPGVLYCVCERDDGAAAVLSLAEPGRPTLLGEPTPVGGSAPTHLTRAGDLLCTANYGSGSVSVLQLRADGAPTGPPRVHRHTGSGPVAGRQEQPHAHGVAVDPSGRWLLSVDLGTDSVRVSAFQDADLRPHREVGLRAGSGPRHLAFGPDGTVAYVVNELEPTLTVCRWDAENGDLRPAGAAALVAPGTTGEAYPSEVVLSADGRTAWVAVRGADSIAVLALDPAHASAELRTSVPCGGHWPRDLTLHPSGQWLYAANERSGDVTVLAVDAETGVPRRAGALDAPAASCVVFGP